MNSKNMHRNIKLYINVLCLNFTGLTLLWIKITNCYEIQKCKTFQSLDKVGQTFIHQWLKYYVMIKMLVQENYLSYI